MIDGVNLFPLRWIRNINRRPIFPAAPVSRAIDFNNGRGMMRSKSDHPHGFYP
jgi:hypothetical protein